jgi:hypothetical protein
VSLPERFQRVAYTRVRKDTPAAARHSPSNLTYRGDVSGAPRLVADFKRTTRFLVGLLVVLEVLVALSLHLIGLNWLSLALLIGMPIIASHLVYLNRRFA